MVSFASKYDANKNVGRPCNNAYDVGDNTTKLLAYCGIFAQGRTVKPAEAAVARERLCK
jgi:hypothetical protein